MNLRTDDDITKIFVVIRTLISFSKLIIYSFVWGSLRRTKRNPPPPAPASVWPRTSGSSFLMILAQDAGSHPGAMIFFCFQYSFMHSPRVTRSPIDMNVIFEQKINKNYRDLIMVYIHAKIQQSYFFYYLPFKNAFSHLRALLTRLSQFAMILGFRAYQFLRTSCKTYIWFNTDDLTWPIEFNYIIYLQHISCKSGDTCIDKFYSVFESSQKFIRNSWKKEYESTVTTSRGRRIL